MLTKLLDDYQKTTDLARELNRHPRTVKRWHLPSIRIGKVEYIHIPSARKALERQLQRRSSRRQPPEAFNKPRTSLAAALGQSVPALGLTAAGAAQKADDPVPK
jgi:hypothetical protein